MPRIFLIDTDTASDDAVALIMALRAPDVRVAAITTVAGNVGVAQATRNALFTVELCGADVPVHVGAGKPLVRAHQAAHSYHGSDGLGDRGYPPPNRRPEKGHAVDAIIDVIEANPGLVLVALGPLTNIALALARVPEIAAKVDRCVVMGGAPNGGGNVTPVAEYNVWCDPDAARIVLRSGLPVELIGWNVCGGEAALDARDIEKILGLPGELARFAIECNSRAREACSKKLGRDNIVLADPVAMSIALDPSIGTAWGEHFVDVEVDSELTRGMTVVDTRNIAGNEYNRATWALAIDAGFKAKVCWAIAADHWKAALEAALSRPTPQGRSVGE